MQKAALMASSLEIKDLVQPENLLKRKVEGIPSHILPYLTINDILKGGQIPHLPIIPPDLQLLFFLRDRSAIERYAMRPIKDTGKQALNTTRAIFFYQLSESHHFERHHDTSRFNLALFTALLTISDPSDASSSKPQSQEITPAARRFMVAYLAAVLERHNTPMVFTKREDFIRRWKSTKWDVYEQFAARQKRVLKKELANLKKMWEAELDKAIKEMGRAEYDASVAPFVGCIVPGRKDQCLMAKMGEKKASMSSVLEGSETKELLDALREPLPEERF
jgi:hypothetical protein